MGRKTVQIALGGSGVVALAIAMYLIGWHSGIAAAAPTVSSAPPAAAFAQAPRTLQELIPLPNPSQREPGQGQSQECKPIVLFYYQGRLYQLQLGPEGTQGAQPQSPPEYFPITPYQGPAIPGFPIPLPPGGSPDSPGFRPVNPRF